MLTSYKHHNLNLGHYLKITEISIEFKECLTGPKEKISKMFKDLNANVEWGFGGSWVFATNLESIQTGWVSKYLMKTRLPLQFIQTPPASVNYLCQYQNSEYDSSTLGHWDRVARFLIHLAFCCSELQIRNAITITKNAKAIWTPQGSFRQCSSVTQRNLRRLQYFIWVRRKQNKAIHKGKQRLV